ncbi:neuronal acetylcholine receptor subunit alpha-7-like isoform X2 [Bacillus rossius redtenbacheri]|uniref:neuronal acetylcholine receptor subunit alpha-7-like isoform X2 n=1 Tax=Bacillus rossius redtenbacheri TaxID=93214 RepID=UPI002FDED6FD
MIAADWIMLVSAGRKNEGGRGERFNLAGKGPSACRSDDANTMSGAHRRPEASGRAGLQMAALLLAAAVVAVGAGPQHPAAKNGNKMAGDLTTTERLKNHLLWDYDHTSRPGSHNVTVVRLQMVFMHVALDQLEGTMTTTGWLRMWWWDQRLRWNDSDYEGLQVVQADVTEIWHPEIFLYNSALDVNDASFAHTPCVFYPTGEAIWIAPCEHHVFCDMDLRRWPYDTQTCRVRLGSWTYSNVDFRLKSIKSELALQETSSEWEVLDVQESRQERQYPVYSEPVVEIEYIVTCRRRSPAYAAVVVAPAVVSALLTLAVFWLPPRAAEKTALGAITAVMVCIFLAGIAQKVPVSAGSTPAIVVFYAVTLHMVCGSVVASVLLANLSTNKRVSPPPSYLGVLLGGGLATLLRLQRPTVERQRVLESEDQDKDQEPPREDPMASWELLCTAVNRLLFLAYCAVFLVLAAACAM